MTDYEPAGPYEVIFPAGEINASFHIIIIDDDEIENDEKLCLYISKFFCGYTDEEPISITIVDNDCK